MGRREETTYQLKRQLGQAMIDLLKDKSFAKIRIGELVQRADVGRATFFRHFSSKEDLLSFYLIVLYQEFVEKSGGMDQKPSLFFEFYRHYKALHLRILEEGLEHTILQAFLQLIAPSVSNDDPKLVYTAYYKAYGLFGATMHWIRSGCMESPKEMTDLYLALLGN